MSDEPRCPQCGTPYAPTDVPSRCVNCGADLPPALPAEATKPLGIEGWFEGTESPPWSTTPKPPSLPVEPPPPPRVEEVVLLEEPPTRPPVVPVVQPSRRPEPPTARVAPSSRIEELPEARRRREPQPEGLVRPPLPPVRESAPPEVPKPRVFLALFVLLAVFVAMACAITVILYALWAGFNAAKHKSQAPAIQRTA